MNDLCYRDLACLLPGIFASVANALDSSVKHADIEAGGGGINIDRLLLTLSSLLDSPKVFRCPLLLILASRVDHANVYFVEQAAVQSITRSLVRLADLRQIDSHRNCPARAVARGLLEFSKLYNIEHDRVESGPSQLADSTIPQLEEFAGRFPAPRPTNRRQTT